MKKPLANSEAHPLAASPWLFGTAVVLLALFIALVLPGQSAGAARSTPQGASFDTSLFYTPGQAFEKAAAHSAEGRFEYIRARWSFDLAWPLVYGLFALTGCAFGLRRLGAGAADRWRLSFLALLGPALDFVENIAATPLKWLFVSVGMAGAVILPAAAGIRAVARRARQGK